MVVRMVISMVGQKDVNLAVKRAEKTVAMKAERTVATKAAVKVAL